jgi:hypothetical protein
MSGLGAGLGALAFWGFIAAIVVAGIWDGARKRDTQHETLRRIIESGKPVDQALVDRLLGQGVAPKRPEVGLRVGGIVILAIAAGLAILGLFVGTIAPDALMPILGAAALLACLGIGLFVAAAYVSGTQEADENSAQHLPRSS